MASPLKSGKQSVKLTSPHAPGSRIRREPPPPVKEEVFVDPEERDRRDVILGVTIFALALFAIIFAFGSYAGWSPSQYTVELRAEE